MKLRFRLSFVCRLGLLCTLAALLTACSDDEAPATGQAAESQAAETSGDPQTGNSHGFVDGKYIFQIDTGAGADPISEYDRRCPVESEDQSLECDWLHALVVVEVVEALEAIERARDQRGVVVAMDALDLPGEPEILVAACRILGQFPDTPGIGDKLTPLLLDSPYLYVQQMAAEVLSRNSDPNLAGLGQRWVDNHRDLSAGDPFDELPEVPAQYAQMGFPVVPEAERFTPADSDRSVGWRTTDSPAAVSDGIRSAVGSEPLDYLQWNELAQTQMMNIMTSIDESKVAEVERLTGQYMEKPDPALLERIQKMQEEIYAPLQSMGEDADKAVANVLYPTGALDGAGVYYFVAEERSGHPSRAILVYPLAGMGLTAVQMAWDLRDYPPAWSTPP